MRVVHVVLRKAPGSTVNALRQHERRVAADGSCHCLLALVILQVEAGVVVHWSHGLQSVLASALADQHIARKSLQDVHLALDVREIAFGAVLAGNARLL